MKPVGLTTLTTAELAFCSGFTVMKSLLPLNAQRIACAGFQYKQDALMHALRDLTRPVTAVVVCTIAERAAQEDTVAKLKRHYELSQDG